MELKTYTVAEAAKILHVNEKTTRGYIKSGKLKASKTGGRRWIIKESDLLSFIEGNS